jgi:aryl-alcohol dehydrogenase-like predicted oxidoreductase
VRVCLFRHSRVALSPEQCRGYLLWPARPASAAYSGPMPSAQAMTHVRLGTSELEVSRLVLGGNVFGWTADERASQDILDSYVAAGGNAIDLADSYPHWAPGCTGGESEEIVGRWMRERGNRSDVVVCTKVGKFPGNQGLSYSQIISGIDGSLSRLQTDYVDLYYCHADDSRTPLEETLRALGELIAAGKVRAIAASNYTADRLSNALGVAEEIGLPRFCAVQPQYSLVVRDEFEGPLQDVCERDGLACLPYWPLAAGFLTGKYDASAPSGARSDTVSRFQTPRNGAILDVVRAVADRHRVAPATVALAWLLTRPTVAAPIASVSRVEQLPALVASTRLDLSPEDLADLDAVSRP